MRVGGRRSNHNKKRYRVKVCVVSPEVYVTTGMKQFCVGQYYRGELRLAIDREEVEPWFWRHC